MTDEIGILHVDDEPDFADMTATFLEREDDRFTVETVTSAAEGLDILYGNEYDCVVSDYDMPGQDGIKFLEQVRENRPDLPFILFTGKGSEEVASDAISAGVTDYLQKGAGTDQYAVLVNRITNAVEHYRSQRALARRNEELRKYERIVNSLHEAAYICDTEGRFELVNEYLAKWYGTTREDLVGEQSALIPQIRERADSDPYQELLDGERDVLQGEIEGNFPSQGYAVLEYRLIPLTVGGTVEAVVGVARDITQSHERERSLTRTKDLMSDMEELADVGAWEYDPETDEMTATDGRYRIYGLDPETELTLEESFELFHPEDRDRLRDRFENCIETGEPYEIDIRVVTPEDEQKWVTARGERIDTNGDGSVVRGYVQDITERKERERELREQREFTQQALDTLDDIFYVLDTEGNIERWNRKMVEATGYDPAELDGMAGIELFPEEDQQTGADAAGKILQEGETTFEADLLTSDGGTVPYEWSGARLTDVDGDTTTGLVGVGRDITERRQRKQRFQALIEESSDIVSIVDADDRYLYRSPAVERILGYDPAETVDDVVWEYIHPEDLDNIQKEFEKDVATGEAAELVEYRARHADGSWRWMEARSNNQLDNPAVEGYIVNSRDITARKEREKELQEVTSQYEALIENFPGGGVFLFDEELRYVRAGGNELNEAGLSSTDIEGKRLHDLFPEEIAEETAHYYQKTLAGERHTYRQEYQGNDYEVRTIPIRDDAGGVIYGMAVLRNITQRVEQKRELEKYRTFVESSLDVVTHVDEEGAILYQSPAVEDVFGYEKNELVGENAFEYAHPDDRERIAEEFYATLEDPENDSGKVEYRVRCADDEYIWVEGFGMDQRDTDAGGVVINQRDISERKRREKEIERQNDLFAKAQDIATVGAWEHYPKGKGIRWTDQVYEMHGLSVDFDPYIENVLELYHPDDRQKLREAVDSATKEGEPYDIEVRMIARDDGDRWIRTVADPQTEDGTVVRVRGIVHDITERKERERRLEQQNERLEEFASVVSHDLRNPLSVAKGRLELVEEDCDSEHLDGVCGALDRMEALIEDILTLACEGSDVGEMEVIEPEEMLQKCWENVETETATLVTEIEGKIEADRSRLKQVYENLLRNAVEHGSIGNRTESDGTIEHGGENVTVTVGELEDRKGFYVADDGVGVPEDERDEVFETGYSTSKDGTGFGLSIVEEIVTAHGWDIEVTESEAGGARFEISGAKVTE